MAASPEDVIRTRAYELWEKAGRVGDAEHHWLKAEQELEAARAQELGDRLRPFYDTLLDERATEEHWSLVVELAVGALRN